MYIHDLDPVAFNIGPIAIHWYGIMHLVAFLIAMRLVKARAAKHNIDVNDLFFYALLGIIFGGKIGHLIFYEGHKLLSMPLIQILDVRIGRSFHGGLIGATLGIYIYCWRNKLPLLRCLDLVAPTVPIGLGLGRIGNFINGELWGLPTYSTYGVIFPQIDMQLRHPVQLYEAILEGLVLFLVLEFFRNKPYRTGQLSGVFLIGYGICRIVAEFWRVPDQTVGYIAFNWLTMGQLLSIPMMIFGVYLFTIRKCSNT